MKVLGNKNFGARECPSCACEVPANSNRCPICSYEFPQRTGLQMGMRLWGGLLMLILFVILAFRLTRLLRF